MVSNITIIGLVDNFKKEIAKNLASKLDMMLADVNELLIYNFVDGNMLDNFGQEYFDKSENKVVKSILSCDNIVINSNISTLNKQNNFNLFKEKSTIVYLRLSLKQFRTVNKIENYGEIAMINEAVFKERDEYMQSICDICIETEELSVNSCVENIMLGLKYFYEKDE